LQTSRALLISAAASFIISGLLSAQSMPEMPDFPDISAPKIGSGFYTPEIPYYPNQKGQKKTEEQSEKKDTSTAKITDASSTTDLISNYLNNANLLSASDISSLADTGSFSTLSSLYNKSSLTSQADSNVLLQQILTNLEDLKKNQNVNISPAPAAKEKTESEPSVLRFKINGYDIKDSLSTVYFSKLEHDGSFLLTADRRYVADKKVRTETFYLLFKAKSSAGSMITYEVCPSIVQDNKNENSFIYKLAEQKNLTATKTGNLVVLRTNGKDCTADLLLDLNI